MAYPHFKLISFNERVLVTRYSLAASIRYEVIVSLILLLLFFLYNALKYEGLIFAYLAISLRLSELSS